jgi:alpha-ketoglutarate-dependent taurine dioxygenase
MLQKFTWSVSTTAFDNAKIPNLDLVSPHPSLGYPCIRYHEPWPSTRTRYDPTEVTIDGLSFEESGKVTDILDSLLYDRRVCYYHEWVEGDLVLSDNVSMMHTRTGFIPGALRELWRIHID